MGAAEAELTVEVTSFRVMASQGRLLLVDPQPGAAARAIAYLQRLESLWSRFLPTSEVTWLNANPGRPVGVAPETAALVDTMRVAWQLTGGIFDPTVLAVLVEGGYAASFDGSGRRTRLPVGSGTGRGMDGVTVEREAAIVTLPPGIALDPGGIGKGLAGDLVVNLLLREAAASGALVSIGGDLAMGGAPPEERGWLVDVERAVSATAGPAGSRGDVCTIAVGGDGAGVATSSTTSRTWVHGGTVRHHLVDPLLRRQSSTDLAAVTLVASTGWEAEAHVTAAILAGSEGVLAYLERHDLTGLAQVHDGEVLATADIADGVAGSDPAGQRER